MIVRVTPNGTESVFYAFGTVANDGFNPIHSLVQGKDGALYGTTTNGGAFGGGGTFFRITLEGSYSILYSFGGSPTDGIVPNGIMLGSDGNFYGTTASGGANRCPEIPQDGTNCGTVFRMTHEGVETILHSFGSSDSDGILPEGPLVEGSDGNLYGTTQAGGGGSICDSCGTVFRMTRAGAVTILHAFGSSAVDGKGPSGVLFQGRDGAFYGTTFAGGGQRCNTNTGCGTVFRVTSAGQLTLLYSFGEDSQIDGSGPSSLIQAADGNFYGTTYSGGNFQCSGCGSVFRLSPSGSFTTLHSFGPVNETPSLPSLLTQGADGALYGFNEWPNTYNGDWTVFKLVLN